MPPRTNQSKCTSPQWINSPQRSLSTRQTGGHTSFGPTFCSRWVRSESGLIRVRTHFSGSLTTKNSASGPKRARPTRLRLIQESLEHYHLALSPPSAPLRSNLQRDCYFNWGHCLLLKSDLASSKATRIEALTKATEILSQSGDESSKAKQSRAVVLAKLGWLAEDVEKVTTAILLFESCLGDSTAGAVGYFNCGNAQFKLARLCQAAGNLQASFDACSGASEKYVASLELLPSFLGPLYNWASVILFIVSKLSAFEPSNSPEFEFGVKVFIQMFLHVVQLSSRTSESPIKLEYLLSLVTQDSSDAVSSLAYQALQDLAHSTASSATLRAACSESLKHLSGSQRVKRLLHSQSFAAVGRLSDVSTLVLGAFANSQPSSSSSVDTIQIGDTSSDEDRVYSLRDFEIMSAPGGLPTSQRQNPLQIDARLLSVRCLRRGLHDVAPKQFLLLCQSLETSCALLTGKQASDYQSIQEAKQAVHFHLAKVKQHFRVAFSFVGHFLSSSAEILHDSFRSSAFGDLSLCFIHCPRFRSGIFWRKLREHQAGSSEHSNSIRWYGAQLYLLLQSLHRKSMLLKRPLDPSQLYMDSKGYLFPLCVPCAESQVTTESEIACFPAQLLAPEVLSGQRPYGASSDWFSFGWFLYAIATRQPLNSNVSSHRGGGNHFNQLYHSILVGQVAKVAESKLPDPSLSSLLHSLLQRDVDARMQAVEALPQHAFFASVDWGAILRREALAPISLTDMEPSLLDPAATVVEDPVNFEFRGHTVAE